MRNAETITAISAKIAAHLSEVTGTTVAPITAEQIRQALDAGERTPLRDYVLALPSRSISPALDSVEHAITYLSLYAKSSHRTIEQHASWVWPHEEGMTPAEVAAAREDDDLDKIGRAFWPDAPDGAARTDVAMHDADAELAAAYDHEPEEWALLREYQVRGRTEIARRYLPDGFVPQGEGEAADAERDLAAWAAMREARDEIVRKALAAGVSKTRVHEITGISRATIDRIPGVKRTA